MGKWVYKKNIFVALITLLRIIMNYMNQQATTCYTKFSRAKDPHVKLYTIELIFVKLKKS